MKCPECDREGLRLLVTVTVDCPADYRIRTKADLRPAHVKLVHVDYDVTCERCPHCGYDTGDI